MKPLGLPELLVCFVVLALLAWSKGLANVAQEFGEAIRNFKGGGPGSPSHPIPANDSAFLTRKRRSMDRD
jgi:Sec-independent protein translocase protein TatA